MTPRPVHLLWVPAGTQVDADWEPPGDTGGLTAGAAHTVEYRRDDMPGSAVIIYLYPAWAEGQPGKVWLQYAYERITGEDPADPVGYETWSKSGHADLPGGYPAEGEAAAAAAHLAALLATCDYAAIDAIDPRLYRDPLEWDGVPYDTQPAAVP